MTAMIAGQLEAKHYLVDLLFRPPVTEEHRRKWVWQVLYAGRNPSRAVTVLDTSLAWLRRFDRGRSYWLPSWVRTELDLADAEERMRLSDNVRRDVRRIRKNRFDYRVSTDERDLVDFYQGMYLPYASLRYGKHSIVMSYDEMVGGIRAGWELLLVRKEGEAVAGQLFAYRNGGVTWWALGVRDGDPALVRQGALAAAYCFGIQHLGVRNARRHDLGGARPFLTDGVLQFKRKWGARITGAHFEPPRWFVLRVSDASAAVRRFLHEQPFVCEDGRGLHGVTFVDESLRLSQDAVDVRRAEYAALGIERVEVVGAGGVACAGAGAAHPSRYACVGEGDA
jgi:hypothetical protein